MKYQTYCCLSDIIKPSLSIHQDNDIDFFLNKFIYLNYLRKDKTLKGGELNF